MTKNVTIQKILFILLRRIQFIIISGAIIGLLTYMYSSFLITPIYSTSTMIFIQNYGKTSTSAEDATESPTLGASTSKLDAIQSNNRIAEKIFSSDIQGSSSLASICVTLFQNSDEITALYDGCAVDMAVQENSFYITITVSGSDPQKCANVANQIADRSKDVFANNFAYGQIGTIRTAKAPGAPISPNIPRNTIIGAGVGIILACLLAIMLDLIDTTIKSDDDIAGIYKIPVFAEIPDFNSTSR